MGANQEKAGILPRLEKATDRMERNGVPEDLTDDRRVAAAVVLANFFKNNKGLLNSGDIASLLTEAFMLVDDLQQSTESVE